MRNTETTMKNLCSIFIGLFFILAISQVSTFAAPENNNFAIA